MPVWSCQANYLSRIYAHYQLFVEETPLSYGRVVELLESDPNFRNYLSELLTTSVFSAFRWETPPVTAGGIDRQFEFVLRDDPFLNVRSEPEVFASYFANDEAATSVMAIPNLGKTATLIVPRQIGTPSDYSHLAAFLRKAPQFQVHALWQCVAASIRENLSDGPIWVSTAGGGVAWLHVRIESRPKYYSYKPYTC